MRLRQNEEKSGMHVLVVCVCVYICVSERERVCEVIMFHCSAIICLFDLGPHVSLVSSSPNWFLVTYL